MGRRPCCSKEGVTRGPWTVLEDNILAGYIRVHGEGKWGSLPIRAGLNRCGKSCRLRWLNYLRPDIKRGNISQEEEDLIIRLHNLLGNRWSLIAGRLPGRTDNEIKNYWNTHLAKKTTLSSSSSAPSRNPKITISPTPTPTPGEKMKKKPNDNNDEPTIISPTQLQKPIRTKPTKRTTGVLFPPLLPHLPLDDHCITSPSMIAAGKEPIRATTNVPSSAGLLTPDHDGSRSIGGNKDNEDDEHALLLDQPIFDEDWVADFFNEMEENVTVDFPSLQMMLDTEEWP